MRISAGLYKNFKLIVPKRKQTRPTSEKLRQTVFNICQHKITEALFLDVCAGSGAMGIEALSRGAKHATFIENSPIALRTIKENLKRLNITNQITILPFDALISLQRLAKKKAQFDLIFIDPPYKQKIKGGSQFYLESLLNFIDQSCLLTKSGILFCEESILPITHLNHLSLTNTRQVGDTYLCQFSHLISM